MDCRKTPVSKQLCRRKSCRSVRRHLPITGVLFVASAITAIVSVQQEVMAFTTSRLFAAPRLLCRPSSQRASDATSRLSRGPPIWNFSSTSTNHMAAPLNAGRAFDTPMRSFRGHSRVQMMASMRDDSGRDRDQSGRRSYGTDNKDDGRRRSTTSWTVKNGRKDERGGKDDFQGTRVFVQGLPKEATWSDLKDHFKIAGEVAFASVSIDSRTNESKQCGIVQFETTDMAKNAIRIIRDHPMGGKKLYVREDMQQASVRSKGSDLGSRASNRKVATKITWEWKCANEEKEELSISNTVIEQVKSLIYERDVVRMKKEFDRSDAIRQDLKNEYGVHLDDRLKMWWVNPEGGGTPGAISEVKGEGRWGKQRPWNQIPTTPENDALVDSDLVNDLLLRRDKARKDKDFQTADELLERAHAAPAGNLGLRIHDESRSWRIWTEAPPKFDGEGDGEDLSANEICMNLVSENEPAKVEEIEALLKKFPGREWTVLRKLKQRYRSD